MRHLASDQALAHAVEPAPAIERLSLTEVARCVLLRESEALQEAANRLAGELDQAVELILAQPGKVVVAGVGKSAHVARKIAATLASTGTPAMFLHAADALHGDVGACAGGDSAIFVSKSGSTAELQRLLPVTREQGLPVVGILGNLHSPLAERADVVLDASVRREADPLGLAPTSSAIVAVGIGDALAAALMVARGFTAGDFACRHPAGQLGRNLGVRVAGAMHPLSAVACVRPEDTLRDVVVALSERPLGAACVLNERGDLVGLITDGDIRRALRAHEDLRGLRAAEVMTCDPSSVAPEALLREALRTMEERPSQISVLPVMRSDRRCVGLLRLHDIYQSALP